MRTPVLLLALALLAACPSSKHTSSDESQNSPTKSSTATGNPQAVPENSTAMNPVAPPQKDLPSSQAAPAAANVVHVQLTEYEIEMPDTLPAGTQQLTITNAGKTNHNFAIEGPGVSQKLASDLTRGDSAPMTVTFQKGTYTAYCPVDGHRGKGMSRTITVQ
jgi:uncharacterized cupredoxin-like copper-binding protein